MTKGDETRLRNLTRKNLAVGLDEKEAKHLKRLRVKLRLKKQTEEKFLR